MLSDPPSRPKETANGNGFVDNNGRGNDHRAEYYLNLHRELDKLEDIILESGPRIIGRTVIDEEQVCQQIDHVRLSVPESIAQAEEILRYKEDLVAQAQQYAEEIVQAAERRASQLVEESVILHQIEQEGNQLRRQVQAECEELRNQTLNEVNQVRRQAQKDLEAMEKRVTAEVQEMQRGADDYSDQVLGSLESQLLDVLKIVQNGRQELRR